MNKLSCTTNLQALMGRRQSSSTNIYTTQKGRRSVDIFLQFLHFQSRNNHQNRFATQENIWHRFRTKNSSSFMQGWLELI
jgi:hypothetical protein